MMAETALYYPGTLCAEELLAAGEMGELVYAEADYVHGLGVPEDAGQVTWRWGYPPMWYITHSLGPIVRLSGQQVTEVVCFGGGRAPEGYANQYGNPFPLETALLRLSGGLTAKITIGFAGVAASGNELIRLYGTKMSLFAHEAPRCDVLIRGAQAECVELPDYRDRLPEPLRVGSILHGSLPFCVHEWISSLTQGRQPVVGVREAVAYTLPGLVAHQSALEGGRALAVPEV
jgi:predicted dehydrogenase